MIGSLGSGYRQMMRFDTGPLDMANWQQVGCRPFFLPSISRCACLSTFLCAYLFVYLSYLMELYLISPCDCAFFHARVCDHVFNSIHLQSICLTGPASRVLPAYSFQTAGFKLLLSFVLLCCCPLPLFFSCLGCTYEIPWLVRRLGPANPNFWVAVLTW